MAQSCKLADRLCMVSVNIIQNTCFVIPDIENVGTNIVYYINPRLNWTDNIKINICFLEFFVILLWLIATSYQFWNYFDMFYFLHTLFVFTLYLLFASHYVHVATCQFKDMSKFSDISLTIFS